jgi:Arc/MetJ-type ribon-helix-helix transcriptional regulator
MRYRCLTVRLTKEQFQILDARVRSAGYAQRSDYVRAVLFMPLPMTEKIDKIYKKVVLDEY